MFANKAPLTRGFFRLRQNETTSRAREGHFMTTRRLRIQPSSDQLEQGIAAIKAELQLPLAFPPEVESAAARAAANPRMPALDRTDIALITIDPPGAMDLDQAMFVERRADGYRVHYAIADVAAFIAPADPVDI
jgi:exoribonuclease R